MNPQTLIFVVAMLACPVGMGLMMWMMNKNMGGQKQGHAMPGHTSEAERLEALRDQRRQLEQEIAEVERIAILEYKKNSLAQGTAPDSQLVPVESARS